MQSGMKVALTGVSGHLGAAVLRELHHRNYHVSALVRDKSEAQRDPEIPVDAVTGDILNPDSLYPFLKDCGALIHCAAVISINGDPDGLVRRTNIDGTRNVLEIARLCGVRRVVHISSIHVYQQRPEDAVLNEARAMTDRNGFAYDRSKKAGQEIALSMNQNGMEVLVMNPTSLIGPYDFKPSKMGRALIGLLTGRQPFVIKGGFDFCDSRDVAHAIVNSLTQGAAGERYLLSGKWHSLKDIASMLSGISGKRLHVRVFPPILARIGLPFVRLHGWIGNKEPIYTNEALEAIRWGNKHISCEKAIRDLNYHARPLKETLRDTYQWYQKSGYLV